MSILLKAIQRVNPLKKSEPKKWYPIQKSTGMIDETEVAELIADETTLNPAEALMAIRQLRKVLLRLLLNGNSVKLGNWGTFSVRLSTTGEADRAKLSALNVKQVNINFQPGEELKAALQKAVFAWVDKLAGDNSKKDDSGDDDDDRPVIE